MEKLHQRLQRKAAAEQRGQKRTQLYEREVSCYDCESKVTRWVKSVQDLKMYMFLFSEQEGNSDESLKKRPKVD